MHHNHNLQTYKASLKIQA